jgi:alpha-glucosidase (family GH31 glycosyl hydrolase)
VFYYQNDTNVYKIDNQYLFGANIMVAPVTEKGATSRRIYLPEGTWYDFYTGAKYSGKKYIDYACPVDVLPLLVKGGAIIPTQPEVQYLTQPVKKYIIDIYPEGNTSIELYDDDGKTTEYQKGAYSVSKIECVDSKKQIAVKISSPDDNFKVALRKYDIKLHVSSQPKGISLRMAKGEISKSPVESSFDKESGILYLTSVGSTDQTFEVLIAK